MDPALVQLLPEAVRGAGAARGLPRAPSGAGSGLGGLLGAAPASHQRRPPRQDRVVQRECSDRSRPAVVAAARRPQGR
eukprot:4321927-Pyramimonas_sp.AAC.1